ncbi:unnamed protein product [Ilex paraguariensis]|uniref:DNA-directed RNA polymerase n=1 Tax=Ilex paraguariensis TaxID=185542 RepID=A0ABC8RXT7_9AQUA
MVCLVIVILFASVHHPIVTALSAMLVNSQIPFLVCPLESGKCESCGTAEPGQCEGHFGYIELPIPVYHPDHDNELKRILSLLCLKMKKRMVLCLNGLGYIELPIQVYHPDHDSELKWACSILRSA